MRLSCVYVFYMCLYIACASLLLPLFSSHSVSSHNAGPRFTSSDWRGIRPPVDAAMVGRVYLSPKTTSPPPARKWKRGRKRPRTSKKRAQRRRQSHHTLFDLWGYDDWFDYSDYSDIIDESTKKEDKSSPAQNVYFFKRGIDTWCHFYPKRKII